MRKLLIAAASAAAMFSMAGAANAMPAPANGIAVDSPVTNVGICFYLDGWNGPGFYECGYRHRRGHGWHGKTRHDSHGSHHSGKHHSSHHSGKSGKSSGKSSKHKHH